MNRSCGSISLVGFSTNNLKYIFCMKYIYPICTPCIHVFKSDVLGQSKAFSGASSAARSRRAAACPDK